MDTKQSMEVMARAMEFVTAKIAAQLMNITEGTYISGVNMGMDFASREDDPEMRNESPLALERLRSNHTINSQSYSLLELFGSQATFLSLIQVSCLENSNSIDFEELWKFSTEEVSKELNTIMGEAMDELDTGGR